VIGLLETTHSSPKNAYDASSRGGLIGSTALWEVERASLLTIDAIERLMRYRRDEFVKFAMRASPFYRKHYQSMTGGPPRFTEFTPVTKPLLMRQFDEWFTRPGITRAKVEAFVRDRGNVGASFLGDCAVWTSSGTTGHPGIFVHDENALAIYDALAAVRSEPAFVNRWIQSALSGARCAILTATGGHFAGVAMWERQRRHNPWLARQMRVISVLQPFASVVQEVNRFQPALLASYPSVLVALAQAQQQGKLSIAPTAVWCGGEVLTQPMRKIIEEVFQAKVVNEYGASECMSIGFECVRGNIHVNADWVVLEAVDAKYFPVEAGTPSHTVLLTNLANRLQPIIRYDLGDSITKIDGVCACGSHLPAVRVAGRFNDTLTLRSARGLRVELLPMALTTAVEEASGIHCFQIEQTDDETLVLRVGSEAHGAGAHNAAAESLRGLLAAHGLTHVHVTLSAQPPRRSAGSGKLRQVIGLDHRKRGRKAQ
jgi:phenylacetate-CoA ligase